MLVTSASVQRAATLLKHMQANNYTPDEGIVALSRVLAAIAKLFRRKEVPFSSIADSVLDSINSFAKNFPPIPKEISSLFAGQKRHLMWESDAIIYRLTAELADILKPPDSTEEVAENVTALCTCLALIQRALPCKVVGGEKEIDFFIRSAIFSAFERVNDYEQHLKGLEAN